MKFIKDMIAKRPGNSGDEYSPDIQRETLQKDLDDSGFSNAVLKRAEMSSRDPFVKKAMHAEEAAVDAGEDELDPVAEFEAKAVADFEAERDAYGETLRAGIEDDVLPDDVLDEDDDFDFDDDDYDDDGEPLGGDFDDSDPLAAEADDDLDNDDDQDDDFIEDDDDLDDGLSDEERLQPEAKEALLAEIRDAMGAMSHIKPDEDKSAEADASTSRHGAWAEDEEFGRQAIARAALDQIDDDDVGDRLLEKTNSKFSDGESSRRRLAIAHMKAAAAATKADRVLKRHTGRDPSNDPEEQHEYRQDLAKVMRPHEPEPEVVAEQQEKPMQPPREQSEHASHRVMEDPETSRDWRETSEDEAIPSIRSDAGGTAPISRPRSERPTSEGRRRIWDMDPEEEAPKNAFSEMNEPAAAFEPEPTPEPERVVSRRPEPEPAPAAASPARRPGRVKTRILGFQSNETEEKDIFSAENKQQSHATKFPVGWIVVTTGPGRGSAFTLFNGVSKIGRAEDQTVALDFGDNSISRDNHAAIAFDSETRKFFLGHGGKSNIVRLNDKPVLSTEEIMNGDTIRIGETTLTFVSFCGADFSWEEVREGGADHAAIA